MSVRTTGTTSFSSRAPAPTAAGASSAGLAIIQIVLIISFPVLLQSQDGERGLIALIFATFLIGFVSRAPAFGVPLTLVYVALMSGLRRWLIPLFGFSNTDPFLLVTSAILILNFIGLLLQRQIPRDSTLSKLVLWIICLMAVEVVNPLQGGVAVGFGGILLLTIPILWFYLARVTVSPAMMSRLFQLALVLATLCTLYGFYQQFVGLLPSEQEYIRITKYSQVMSANTARVFSTLSGFAEYALFISIGAVIAFAYVLKRNKMAIFVFIFMAGAAVFSSSRGVLVAVLATCVVLWAIQGTSTRSWWPRLAVAAVLGIGGTFWSLKQVKENNVFKDNTSASELIGHQTQLLDPFGKKSTGGGHLALQLDGIVAGTTHPFGYGTGSVTLAASRFGGEEKEGFSAEGDFGNAFIALGVVGGCIFLYLVYCVYRDAFLNWHYYRDFNSLCALAVVLVIFGQWLTGGNYIVAMMVWFSIGYIDRSAIDRRRNRELASPTPARRRLPRSLRERRARSTNDGGTQTA